MNRKIYIVLLASIVSLCAELQAMNYFCGFENQSDTAGWVFAKRPALKSNFVVGQAISRIGSRSMYVSADNGATAGYESTASGYIIVAYRKFTFAAGIYDLAFDLRIVGDAQSNNDVLRVACFPTTAPDGTAQTPKAASIGSSFPQLVTLNTFKDNKGNENFANMPWTNILGTLNIPSAGDYWLAFYFKESGGVNSNFNPGPCIDNIQICTHQLSTHCAAPPTNLKVSNQPGQLVVSWQGNATSYELMYYNSSTTGGAQQVTVINNIPGTSYAVPLNRMDEGVYNFHVRSICAPDTSVWVESPNFLVYDPSLHCLDYLNFNAPGVTCTSGVFSNPYQAKGVKDFGPESINSMHTVHYNSNEYDRLTGYQLKTVPDGAIASVRLSNWTEYDSPSGSIEYTYTVKSDAKVLLLRYAAVLQYASHHPANEQTRIHIEILDSATNRLLSQCTEADFNAKDVAEGNTRGWKTYIPKPGEVDNTDCPIKWLDWAVLGINLEQYIGRTVKIRLTLYACSADFHFGYAYFTLDCSKGDIEGMSCGVVPDSFTVSDGFDYKWYKVSDPTKTAVCTTRTFVPEVGDTCSYYVDLMYPENNDCKFTLTAYTLPRVPKPMAKFAWTPSDCQNRVTITNLSHVQILEPGKPNRPARDTVHSYLWDMGKYGTSKLKTPQLVVPNEGDTFNVILRATFNGCMEYDTFRVEVPPIGESVGRDTAHICEGGKVTFNGKEYDQPGDYIDTLRSVYGCDSILQLHLEVLIPDTFITFDTICSDKEIEFFGQTLNKTGKYTHTVLSKTGCDSLYYEKNLYVHETLIMELETPENICADDDNFVLPYNITQGIATDYSVKFDSEQFEDIDLTPAGEDKLITVDMPENIRPNKYTGTATFYNSDCGNVSLPFEFTVKYPSTVITQRWNDVLSVYNSDYNGGYEFVAYQWFVDNEPIAGMTNTLVYQQGKNLEFGRNYSVLLTRADDGISLMSCQFVPVEYSSVEQIGTVIFSGSTVAVNAEVAAKAELFTFTGMKIGEWNITEGSNELAMPTIEGTYILRIIYQNGYVQTERVVVRK